MSGASKAVETAAKAAIEAAKAEVVVWVPSAFFCFDWLEQAVRLNAARAIKAKLPAEQSKRVFLVD